MSEAEPGELHLATASTGGSLIYAIGDVHGCYDQLLRLLTAITRDAEAHAGGRRPVLVFCGDYVDRGPDSARVLSTLVWLHRHAGFEVHTLMGNHERVMLDVLADPALMRNWLDWGGDATLASYGVAVPDGDDEAGFVRARDDLVDVLPVSHLRLLERLEMMIGIGGYAFVHAGVRPGVPLHRQVENDLLWIREPFLGAADRHERMIVHGHSWTGPEAQIQPNRIGIDTGAYSTGVLTAVRLEDEAIDLMRSDPA